MYKHYPYLDKEIDIAGLEPFEILIFVVAPIIVGALLFIILPFKIPVVFATFISIVIIYVLVRRKKSGKNKGYVYREFLYKYLPHTKKIY